MHERIITQIKNRDERYKKNDVSYSMIAPDDEERRKRAEEVVVRRVFDFRRFYVIDSWGIYWGYSDFRKIVSDRSPFS